MRVKLTDERLQKRPRGREVLRDRQVPGLFARGNAAGGWTFCFQGTFRLEADGSRARQWKTLGPWSPIRGAGLTVREARAAALAEQDAPTAVPNVAEGRTVRDVAGDWLEARYPDNEKRRAKMERLLECHLYPSLGATPIAAVTKSDCVKLVRATLKQRRVDDEPGNPRRGGRAPAKMLIDALGMLFDYAEKTDKIPEGRSPARLLEPGDFGIKDVPSRDRALTADELAMLYLHPEVDLPGLLSGKRWPDDGLDRLSISTRAAIILGPLVATRPATLIGMKWAELDLKARTWTVKGGRGQKVPHHLLASAKVFTVPLSDTAVRVLEALRTHWKPEVASPYVLPAETSSGHLSGDVYAAALQRLTTSGRLELPDGPYRPHDARRTWASEAERLGVEEPVIEKALGHSIGKVAGTYRTDTLLERRRQAMELVDETWTAVREGRKASVVPIRK